MSPVLDVGQVHTTIFSKDAGCQSGTDARDVSQRLRDPGQVLFDPVIQSLQMLVQKVQLLRDTGETGPP